MKPPSKKGIRDYYEIGMHLTLRYVTDQTLSGLLPALKDKVIDAIIAGEQLQ